MVMVKENFRNLNLQSLTIFKEKLSNLCSGILNVVSTKTIDERPHVKLDILKLKTDIYYSHRSQKHIHVENHVLEVQVFME